MDAKIEHQQVDISDLMTVSGWFTVFCILHSQDRLVKDLYNMSCGD